jgi:hypothetical protein
MRRCIDESLLQVKLLLCSLTGMISQTHLEEITVFGPQGSSGMLGVADSSSAELMCVNACHDDIC